MPKTLFERMAEAAEHTPVGEPLELEPEKPAGYVSPYGQPRGLRSRLGRIEKGLRLDRSYPWLGTGIIEDLRLVMALLDKREWLEAMRLSDDPDAQRFAAELLADDEAYEAANDAAAHVGGLPKEPHALDPVETIEKLDPLAVGFEQVRKTLQELNVIDEQTSDDEIPGLIRVLLS